jgi:hypothetical protein
VQLENTKKSVRRQQLRTAPRAQPPLVAPDPTLRLNRELIIRLAQRMRMRDVFNFARVNKACFAAVKDYVAANGRVPRWRRSSPNMASFLAELTDFSKRPTFGSVTYLLSGGRHDFHAKVSKAFRHCITPRLFLVRDDRQLNALQNAISDVAVMEAGTCQGCSPDCRLQHPG